MINGDVINGDVIKYIIYNMFIVILGFLIHVSIYTYIYMYILLQFFIPHFSRQLQMLGNLAMGPGSLVRGFTNQQQWIEILLTTKKIGGILLTNI